jgi:hypothetical protein
MMTEMVILSPILVYACVQCGESNAWSRTMYRSPGEKPYTRTRCYGCGGHCWGEQGKWMTPDEAEVLWMKQYEIEESVDELSHLEPQGDDS